MTIFPFSSLRMDSAFPTSLFFSSSSFYSNFSIFPWLPRRISRQSQGHELPAFPPVAVDPYDPNALLVRFFRSDHLVFITGRIILPCRAEIEHTLDAENLLRTMARIAHLNLRDEYVSDRDTRPMEPGETQDLFYLDLSSDDKSVSLELTVVLHPNRKFMDPMEMGFRKRQTLSSLSWHVGLSLPREGAPGGGGVVALDPDTPSTSSSVSTHTSTVTLTHDFWHADSQFFYATVAALLDQKAGNF